MRWKVALRGLRSNPITQARPVWFASIAGLHASSICHRRDVVFQTAWKGPIGPPTPNSSSGGAPGNDVRFVWKEIAAESFGPEERSPSASYATYRKFASFSTVSWVATEFPPRRERSFELFVERIYSPPGRRPSGLGGFTAHRDSITGRAAAWTVDGVDVSTGKFAGSTRSAVPKIAIAAGVGRRAPTRSPGAASGAISNDTRSVFVDPTRNWRVNLRVAFPVALNRPAARIRSEEGCRRRSRFVSSNSFTRDTSAERVPLNVTVIPVTVTAPLFTVRFAQNIGASVCHCLTVGGFTPALEATRKVSTPSTIRVLPPGTYEFTGKFAEDTLSGASTVRYEAARIPAPIQSPGGAPSEISNVTNRSIPAPAGIEIGLGNVRLTDPGVPVGLMPMIRGSREVFSTPSPFASRQTEIVATSPGAAAVPVASTRTRRRVTDPVGVDTFTRSIGTSFCPGSTVAGERFALRRVRTSPGGPEVGG